MIAVLEINGEIVADVTFAKLKNEYAKFKNVNEIHVYINSIGGDVREGFAIHDWLISLNKKLVTIVESKCYSIATVIFLAAKKENRLIAKNAELMIHNAWMYAVGNAQEIEKQISYLKKVDDQLANFYSEKLNFDIEKIKKLMSKEIFLNSKEAIKLGFASKEFIYKAVAKFHLKQEKRMEKEKSILAEIKRLVNGFFKDTKPKNLLLQTQNGESLYVFTEDETILGKNVVLADGDGNPTDTPAPDGFHTLSDGRVIQVENGIIINIVEDVIEEIISLNEEVEKKEEEIQNLKKENEAMKSNLNTVLAKINELEKLIHGENKTVSSIGNGNKKQILPSATRKNDVFEKMADNIKSLHLK